MAIELSGGCRVSLLREGAAKEQGTLREWQHAGRENGAAAISLRVLELAPGRSPRLGGTACDEVLYVFEGKGTLHFEGGGSRSIGPDTCVYVPPGASFEIENSEAAEGEVVADGVGGVEAGQRRSQGPGGFPVGALAAVEAEERGDAVDVGVDRHDQFGGIDEIPDAEVGRGAADHPAEEEVHPFAGGVVGGRGEEVVERFGSAVADQGIDEAGQGRRDVVVSVAIADAEKFAEGGVIAIPYSEIRRSNLLEE